MKQHQTIRLSEEARSLLREIAGDDSAGNLTAAIEEMIYARQRSRVAFGQQVQLATAALIEAVRSGDEAQIGAPEIRLAELLRSLPAATGIAAALRAALVSRVSSAELAAAAEALLPDYMVGLGDEADDDA